MNWKLKAYLQKALALFPGSRFLYRTLQTKAGGFRDFNPHSKLFQGRILIECLQQAGISIEGKRTLEIGTGWVPVVPIFFYLLGQESCYSYDIATLLEQKLTLSTLEKIINDPIVLQAEEKYPILRIRKSDLAGARSYSDLMATCRIQYHAPADLRHGLEGLGEIDLVYSNTTLEHIPLKDLRDIFQAAYRLLPAGGVMAHEIDFGDHYSHFDHNIGRINFLQFSEQRWRLYNNPFQYQNRLRASEYQRLAEESGFTATLMNITINQPALAQLPTFPLHPDFQIYSPEDICATGAVLLARKER